MTNRVLVHLPQNKRVVIRINLKESVRRVFDQVCVEKQLYPPDYVVYHPETMEPLDLQRSLNDYNITEIVIDKIDGPCGSQTLPNRSRSGIKPMLQGRQKARSASKATAESQFAIGRNVHERGASYHGSSISLSVRGAHGEGRSKKQSKISAFLTFLRIKKKKKKKDTDTSQENLAEPSVAPVIPIRSRERPKVLSGGRPVSAFVHPTSTRDDILPVPPRACATAQRPKKRRAPPPPIQRQDEVDTGWMSRSVPNLPVTVAVELDINEPPEPEPIEVELSHTHEAAAPTTQEDDLRKRNHSSRDTGFHSSGSNEADLVVDKSSHAHPKKKVAPRPPTPPKANVKNPPVMHDHRQRTAHLSQSKRAEKEEEVRFESVSAHHSLEMAVDSQEESDNPTLAPPPEFEDSSGPPSLPSTNVKETSEPPSPRLSLNREVSNSPSLDVFVDNPSPPPFLDQPTAYDAEIRASPSPPPSVDMEQNSIASSVDLSGPRGDVFVSKEQAELETNGIAHSPSSESVDEYIVKKDTRNLCSQLAFEPQAESEEDGQMEVKFVPSPICLDLKPKMAGEPVVRVPSGREKRRLVRSMAEIRLANPNQANADVWADSDAASESAVINRRHLSASDGGIVTMNASTATLVDSEPQTNSDLPSEHSERTHSTFFSAHRPTSPPWTDASGGHSVSNSEYTDPTIIELEQQLHQWRNQLEQNRRQLERSSSAREPLVNGQSLMQQQIQLQQALMEQMERNILTLKSKRAVSEPPMALANGNGHSTHTSTSSFDQPPNQSSAAHVAPRIVRQCDQHRDAAKPIFDSRLHYRPASVGDGNIPKHDPTPASPPGTSARAARMASREEWRTDTLRSDEV